MAKVAIIHYSMYPCICLLPRNVQPTCLKLYNQF
uniref:Uncharacterized protein n=1 Tax=Arundo donax TaxID=35708 RepID=A0A0A9F5U2_ARUDO